ncbi:DUF4960 domain-containing protein [Epilithonimonas sp.]|uniref:DUF4960 domain-containing protein n=1 Tax=Epilithonimonas sp. TaxID=2894511 RepID=UPI002FDED3B1
MRKLYLSVLVALLSTNISAQMKKIAFIGQAEVYNSNVPTASDGLTYDDDKAAAVWFMETFVPAHSGNNISGNYFSFQDIAEGADISSYDVIWIQSDGATFTERLNEWPRGTIEANGDKHCILREVGFQWNQPCGQLEDDFMWKIKQFYKSGKKLLLGNFAGKGLEVFGVFDGLNNPWEYKPNQSFGDTVANPENTAAAWGTNWSGNQTPILLTGISTNAVSCTNTSQSIEFLTAGTEKKNRALQYNLNWGRIYDDAGGASSTISQRRQIFQNTLNAEILLENCDGTEIQAAKFNPKNSGDGTIIWYGSGVYDWYTAGGSNQNVKKLTENTLLYLADKENILIAQDYNKTSEITLYPNPVSSVLNIKMEGKIKSEIYDMNGRKVVESISKSINIHNLLPGTYFIKVQNENTSSLLKFIKK